MAIVKNRIGDRYFFDNGTYMEIIECFKSKNITVIFDDGTIVYKKQYDNFLLGAISNPLSKTVYGIGYLGFGSYKSTSNAYYRWRKIFERCYDKNFLNKNTSYLGCSVHPDWHNFQNFAEWYCKNNIKGWQIDKDILFKGNKIYGQDTCCFVPMQINNLFTKSNSIRGKYYIGVSYIEKTNKYYSSIKINSKKIDLGRYDSNEEAYEVYKKNKEAHIKVKANEFKPLLKKEVYNALIEYKVEITD